jgi:ABC-type nickel/cobalt efflux system permease component RcnA
VDALTTGVLALMSTVVSASFGLALTVFAGFHLYLSAKNYTTIEFSDAPVNEAKSPWCLGSARENLRDVFGSRVWMWVLPVRSHTESGFHFGPPLRPYPYRAAAEAAVAIATGTASAAAGSLDAAGASAGRNGAAREEDFAIQEDDLDFTIGSARRSGAHRVLSPLESPATAALASSPFRIVIETPRTAAANAAVPVSLVSISTVDTLATARSHHGDHLPHSHAHAHDPHRHLIDVDPDRDDPELAMGQPLLSDR